ncbi:MAG: TonB-dependent receptor, partial [Proteobacteria bacterium]|nr:TonB-dependent receptor [Pseudomonadota bacterium]
AIQSFVGEATLASRGSGQVQWLAGAFAAHTRQSTHLDLTPSSGSPLYDEARRDDLDEAALFGEVRLALGRRFAVTLGGRAFSVRTDVSSLIHASAAGPTAFDGSVRKSGLAPKVVVSYQAVPEILVYVQAAEGYRAGGVNTPRLPGQTFSTGGGAEPDRLYQGDELWSLEAGVRASGLQDRLSLRAALYDAVWRNIQSDELLASGLPFTANIGNGGSRGLELEATYRQDRTQISANLLVDDPELSHANPAFPARPELGLAGAPSAMGAVSLHHEWPRADGSGFSIDGRLAYVGASHLTFDERTSPRMPAYVTGRLALSWRVGAWRLGAAVENPANTRGDTFAYGNPFTVRGGQQVTPLRPRTITLRLGKSFP